MSCTRVMTESACIRLRSGSDGMFWNRASHSESQRTESRNSHNTWKPRECVGPFVHALCQHLTPISHTLSAPHQIHALTGLPLMRTSQKILWTLLYIQLDIHVHSLDSVWFVMLSLSVAQGYSTTLRVVE